MGATSPKRYVVVLLLALAALSMVLWPLEAAIDLPWHIHVVNGLSNANLLAHCKSGDDDLGNQNIAPGTEFNWNFNVNLWQTTLFWCYLAKLNADVSFEAFWVEKHSSWLNNRCSINNCIWIARDDGIYLRNNLDKVDELIHSWNNKT